MITELGHALRAWLPPPALAMLGAIAMVALFAPYGWYVFYGRSGRTRCLLYGSLGLALNIVVIFISAALWQSRPPLGDASHKNDGLLTACLGLWGAVTALRLVVAGIKGGRRLYPDERQ
jgi:hypothetical protein